MNPLFSLALLACAAGPPPDLPTLEAAPLPAPAPAPAPAVPHEWVANPPHGMPDAVGRATLMPHDGFPVACPEERSGCNLGPPYHYDAVFRPPPLGRLMHAATDAQVRNGEATLMTLHRIDFLPDSAELNRAGMRRLARIARRLPSTFEPVIVEPPAAWTANGAALAEARRERVAALLAAGPFPVPPQRVVLAPDPADGLAGTDAELVYRNLLILSGSGGKLRTRFDVFGSAAQQATAPTATGPAAAGPAR